MIYQYLCVYNNVVGYFTNPTILDRPGEDPVVAGSFSDTLGTPVPVIVPMEAFLGRFTTLVRKGDSANLGLPVHPTDPDMIRGNGMALLDGNAPVEASLDCLNFPMVENPTPADFPVIAALPHFLPVGPPVHPLPVFNVPQRARSYPLHYCGGLASNVGFKKSQLGGTAITSAGYQKLFPYSLS